MKFAFTCDICGRDMKRADKFEVMVWEQEDESCQQGVEGAEETCKPCAMKVVNKIVSMRRAAKRKAA